MNTELKLTNIDSIKKFNEFKDKLSSAGIDIMDSSLVNYLDTVKFYGFEIINKQSKELVSAGLFAEPSKNIVDIVLKNDLVYLFDSSEDSKQELKEVSYELQGKAYLASIYTPNSYRGKGYPKTILSYLKKKYKGYFVYSLISAESYWSDVCKLKEIEEHLYVS